MICRLGERASKRWATARALLIAYFIVFSVIAALPTPGNASHERLARPFEREELRRWAELFGSAGISVTPEELGRAYIAFSKAYYRARELVLSPIQGWMSLTRTDQSWRLFGTPDEDAYALTITAHSAAGDELLYESGNPERSWNAALLEYRRIRADYNPTRSAAPRELGGLARYLAERIFESRPDAERVTVALVKRRIPLPGRDAASGLGAGEPRHVIELSRSAR